MAVTKITDITIRSLKPPERGQKTYWDTTLKGFGVRVSQGGTKTFTVMYGADRRLETIGRVGTVKLADARAQAKQILAEHILGKRTLPNISWQEAQKRFLEASSAKNKPRTTSDYEKLLNRHFKLSRILLADLSQRDLMRRIDRLKDTPSEQNHAFVALRVFLKWCVKNHYLAHSPLEGQSLPAKVQSRSRVLSELELKLVLGKALEYGHPFGPIVSLLILTGQRRGEITALRWDWIGEADTITLPAEITKNGREHIFPIGKTVRAILDEIPRTDDYLFPAARNHVKGRPTNSFNGWSTAKPKFDKGLQVAPYTLHDLRRTFSTVHASIGTPIHVTEKLLNHISGTHSGVQAIYNRHTYLPEMRKAVQTYEGHLAKILALGQSST